MTYESRLSSFIDGITAKMAVHYAKHYENLEVPEITIKSGRKYDKVVLDSSVYAFIDKTTGDIFKPAGWKAPAKGVRGNIFTDDYGLTRAGVFGMEYNR